MEKKINHFLPSLQLHFAPQQWRHVQTTLTSIFPHLQFWHCCFAQIQPKVLQACARRLASETSLRAAIRIDRVKPICVWRKKELQLSKWLIGCVGQNVPKWPSIYVCVCALAILARFSHWFQIGKAQVEGGTFFMQPIKWGSCWLSIYSYLIGSINTPDVRTCLRPTVHTIHPTCPK